MKVIAFHELGAPEVLPCGDAPTPVNTGEVQVSVLATGINEPDWYLHEDSKAPPPEWRPSAFIPGSDLSGNLEAIEDYVDGIAPGDVGFGMIRFERFSIASCRVGQPSRIAEQTNFFGAQLGKPMSATTPTHGRLRW